MSLKPLVCGGGGELGLERYIKIKTANYAQNMSMQCPDTMNRQPVPLVSNLKWALLCYEMVRCIFVLDRPGGRDSGNDFWVPEIGSEYDTKRASFLIVSVGCD